MFDHPFQLAAVPGVGQPIPAKGNFVRYDRETSGAADPVVEVKAHGGSGGTWTMRPGQSCKLPEAAAAFSVANKTGVSAITGVLKIGEGDFSDSSVTGTVTSIPAKPTTIDTVADVALNAGAATQILAADTARRAALISNLAANLNAIRVGDSNVAAARGAQVQPGQTITIEGTEAIFGFDAAAESVGVTVIKD